MNCENVDKLISAYVDREVPADLEPKIRYHLRIARGVSRPTQRCRGQRSSCHH